MALAAFFPGTEGLLTPGKLLPGLLPPFLLMSVSLTLYFLNVPHPKAPTLLSQASSKLSLSLSPPFCSVLCSYPLPLPRELSSLLSPCSGQHRRSLSSSCEQREPFLPTCNAGPYRTGPGAWTSAAGRSEPLQCVREGTACQLSGLARKAFN